MSLALGTSLSDWQTLDEYDRAISLKQNVGVIPSYFLHFIGGIFLVNCYYRMDQVLGMREELEFRSYKVIGSLQNGSEPFGGQESPGVVKLQRERLSDDQDGLSLLELK